MIYLIIFIIIIVIILFIDNHCKNIEEKERHENLEYKITLEYYNNYNKKLKSIDNRQIDLNIYEFYKNKTCSEKAGYNHYPNYKYCDCGWILK